MSSLAEYWLLRQLQGGDSEVNAYQRRGSTEQNEESVTSWQHNFVIMLQVWRLGRAKPCSHLVKQRKATKLLGRTNRGTDLIQRPSFHMMKLKTAAVLFLSMFLSVTIAAPAMAERVYDASSGNWVEASELAPVRGKRGSAIRKEIVSYETRYAPGTLVIETGERRLYLVLEDGKAMKYGIGVGRDGFTWSGTHNITRKAEWPGWTPPPQMRKRVPDLPAYMPGGPDNPLGARALYIGSTLYRVHGTSEPWSIGQAVSSGCIRLTNEDITDLYERVKVGARIVVNH
jgi:lipoprotein-anchoring transpeptidase ErfK/SrfK